MQHTAQERHTQVGHLDGVFDVFPQHLWQEARIQANDRRGVRVHLHKQVERVVKLVLVKQVIRVQQAHMLNGRRLRSSDQNPIASNANINRMYVCLRLVSALH